MKLPENISQLNTVFLHDWLVSHRGGERVLQGLLEPHPNAPIYTLLHNKGTVSKEIESHLIHSSFLANLPFSESKYRHYLPLMPSAAESIKLPAQTELIISSSHCVIKSVKKPKKNTFHVCYIHSPMRYLYDQYDSYFGPGSPLINRIGMSVFKNYLVHFDQHTNNNVDLFVSNSKFVQDRILKYYKRSSIVVNPFVDFEDYTNPNIQNLEKKDYYLIVSAFAPNKRIDLAVQAFNKLNLPLKIIGSGQDEKRLKAMANSNIEFLGPLSRDEVLKHFVEAKAFVFPGVEDFGITPLESLAANTPVIAFNLGGATETLNDKVAQFFNEPTVDSLVQAIEKSKNKFFDKNEMQTIIKKYSKQNFQKTFYDIVSVEYDKFKQQYR